MDLKAAFAACEKTVREHDPDRYFSALFAPEERRPLLFALYAFNHEVARVAETVSEPMVGRIRLQWWREAVLAARDLHQRGHDVAHALVEVFASIGPPLELFDAILDAREKDARDETFADFPALEEYADATSGNLMRLAARVLGTRKEHDALAREAGIAYGLTGILRAVPFHAAHGNLMLPLDLLRDEGLVPDMVFAGNADARLKAVMRRIAGRARERLAAARRLPRPGAALSAFMPAALAPLYLSRMTKASFDPLRNPSDMPLFRRQMTLLRASVTGRV